MDRVTKSFCSPGKGVRESEIAAIWSSEYCRKSHPNFENCIETQWEKKMAENIYLFDAPKFRLHDLLVEETSEISPKITFLLGTTSYKDFIGTNYAPFAYELEEAGTVDFGDGKAYLANPLGVGALVETLDSKFIFIRRSQECAELQGLIDMPGGHPEPDVVVETCNNSLENVDPAFIIKEIFTSSQKEVRDEVNIPLEQLSEPILLGISYNMKTCYRPSLLFYIRCDLSCEEVQAKYMEQTQSETNESTDLVVLSPLELLRLGSSQSGSMWSEFTPSAKSATWLFSIFHSK